MIKQTRLVYDGTLSRFKTSRDEMESIPPAILRHMLFHLYLIRKIELRLLELKDLGQVNGPVHSSMGQEGTAIGSIQPLAQGDQIASTHRGHHHFLAKAYNAYAGGDYDPLESIPGEIPEVTERTMAEIMGLAKGYCRGRGGSMHLGDRQAGCIGTNAIVAGGVPAAAGTAWAAKIDGVERISVAYLGDGALNQGAVYETMNMAALWRIPVIFFVENNLYAVATHVKQASAVQYLAQRGLAHGIESIVVDGMDPIAVMRAMEYARKRVLEGECSPFMIEALNYRYKHQAQSLPGSAFGYRTKEEEDEWHRRDPLSTFPAALIKHGVLTKEQNDFLDRKSDELVDAATDQLTRGEGEKRVVRLELFPKEEDLTTGVWSDGHEHQGVKYVEREQMPGGQERKFIEVVPEVMHRRMEQDETIIVLGEEVGQMKGGVAMATRGLVQAFPDRVVNTPISEAGFCGMALGLALMGKKPIIEIMYPDFTLVAADQVFNQIGKNRYMYGNQSDLPIILRTKVAISTGYGAQHSLEPAPLYALYPGWRILAPSNPFDYVGLFNSAVRCLDPVLLIEHGFLYEEVGMVPDDRDYSIEIGKARVARAGSDVTVIAYSYMTTKVLRAAQELESQGISAEVIDLRTVDYAHIDYETIGVSIAKTGRVVVCEEGLYCGGIGAQVSFEIQKRFFDFLDGEIARVAGVPVPVPVSRAQEERAIPDVKRIVDAVASAAAPRYGA